MHAPSLKRQRPIEELNVAVLSQIVFASRNPHLSTAIAERQLSDFVIE